jgi:DNA-binding beta-propeller fold protein YncE
VAVEGSALYVADAGNDRVVVFDTQAPGDEDAYLREFGSTGAGDGRLRFPTGVALDGGFLWVVDSQHDRLVRFRYDVVEANHVFDAEARGSFSFPASVVVSGDALYVTDTNNHRVVRLEEPGAARLPAGRQASAVTRPRRPGRARSSS